MIEGKGVKRTRLHQSSMVFGDVPLLAKPGTYTGNVRHVELPLEKVEVTEVLPKGIAVNPERSETYFAFAYVKAKSHAEFFEQISKIRRGVLAYGPNDHG
jgi:hypothetical protein